MKIDNLSLITHLDVYKRQVSGSVNGEVYVGGVVGKQPSGSMTGCSSSATVKGTVNVGGVAGESWGSMTACYATGHVTLEIYPGKDISGGGVVGFKGGNSVLACYATVSYTHLTARFHDVLILLLGVGI